MKFATILRGHFCPTAALVGVLGLALHVPAAATDITFAFTADVHSAFDGYDDSPGLQWSLLKGKPPTDDYFWLLKNETWTTPRHDGCQIPGSTKIGGMMDLCNQIQLVRKLNALPGNVWPTAASYGQPISPPRGLLIGGDLTLCGIGIGGQKCGDPNVTYNGIAGAQLGAFAALFDRDVINSYTGTLGQMSFLTGLNFSNDLPLHYAIYPALGNHDTDDNSVLNYLMNWGIFADYANGDRKVTNRYDATGAYSLDWDGVHIISAGVCAGCDASYNYSDDSLKWFTNDLATYASDGRPVILYQHFGFDHFCLTNDWYSASQRIEAYWKLWKAIANYNVIGIFTGHNHSQNAYYQYPTTATLKSSQAPYAPFTTVPFNPSAAFSDTYLPYDVFLPGAGYLQNFAVARVTDRSFEVATTKPGLSPKLGGSADDYDGSGHLNLNATLSKRLVPGPKNLKQTRKVDVPTQQAAGLLTSDRSSYIVNVKPSGDYYVWTVNQNKLPQDVVSSGTGFNGTLVPYYDPASGETRALRLNDGAVSAYRIVKAGPRSAPLQLLWESSAVSGSGFMIYNPGGAKHVVTFQRLAFADKTSAYLIVDIPGSSFYVYRIDATGLTLVGSVPNPSTVNTTLTQLLPIAYSGGDGFIRYSRTVDGVNAEFYRIDDSRAAQGIFAFPAVGAGEQWPMGYTAREIRMIDGSTQILLQRYLQEIPIQESYPQSPYYIRSVHADGRGTDVSWRGLILPTNATSFAQLGYTNEQSDVIAATSDGLMLHYQMGLYVGEE